MSTLFLDFLKTFLFRRLLEAFYVVLSSARRSLFVNQAAFVLRTFQTLDASTRIQQFRVVVNVAEELA